MNDQDKSREQLIAELVELRQRVAGEGATPELKTAAALFRVAPLGIHACDTEGRITRVNPSQEAITGYTADELVGTYVWDHIAPGPEKDSLPAYFKHLVSEQPAPTPFFAKNVRKSGEVFDVRIDWNYIRNAQGEVTGFVSIVADVTEGKRKETALRESERRLSTLLSNLPGVAYRCRADSDATVEFLSDGYVALTGYDLTEQLGQPESRYLDRINPDDRQRAFEVIQEAIAARKQFQIEYRLRTASGQEKWVWEQGTGVFSESGELEAVEGFAIDITERKRAEEELARNKAILQAAIESLPFEFFAIGPDGRYILQNAILREHYGDAIGKQPKDYASDEYTRQLWLDNNRRAFAGERVEGEIEAYIGDETRHYYNVITPIRDEGEICGILGVNVDITGRKRAENELQQANDHLEQRVLERTAELTTANERLQAEVAQRQYAEDALRQNEAKYRALVESSPDAVVMVDLQGRIAFASQRAAEQHGALHPDEVVGSQATDFVVKEDRDKFRASIGRLIEEGVHRNVEYTLLRKNGTTFDAEVSSAVIRDAAGNAEALMAVYRDITNRKRAEEELRDSEERLNFALEASGIGALDLDLVHPTAHRSLQHDRIFGYPCLLPSWTYEMFLEHVLPEDRQTVDQQFRQALDTHSDWTAECRIRRSDGQVRWIWAAGHHRSNGSGNPRRMTGIVQDITDRKKAEEDIRQSEAKYRALVESSPDAVVMVDLQGRIAFASQRAAVQHGARHPHELLGTPAEDLVVEQERERFRCGSRLLIEQGVRRNDQYTGLRRDGTTFAAELSSAIIRDAAGNPEGLMGVYRDVTERKRAEEKLETLGRFVEAASQGFGMADLEGQITYVNPYLARLFGAPSPEDVIGTHVSKYYPAEHVQRREQNVIPVLRRREHWQSELTMVFPDGELRSTIQTTFPVCGDNGELLCTATVLTDITELKKAEEALRQSYQELRILYDGAVDGLAVYDIERLRSVQVNPALCQILGYGEEELKTLGPQQLHPLDDLPRIRAHFEAVLEKREFRYDALPCRRKDGVVVFCDTVARHIAYHGRPCLLVFFHDVTDRKQAEAKVKAQQQALRRMLLASDHERQLITYELHDGVAQQLMGAIMHFQSQEPRKGRKSKATDAYREGMEALRQASLEIRSVMSRLRTPVLDMYGLTEAIADVVSQMRSASGAAEIEYSHAVKFERLEPTLENTLFRIAQEAMTNACRHSKSEKVRVKLTQKGDDVTLEIRDWGIGFDQGTVQENRFGLEGIRERCRILGGKLSIKSEPGKGTMIRVKFPVIEAPDEE